MRLIVQAPGRRASGDKTGRTRFVEPRTNEKKKKKEGEKKMKGAAKRKEQNAIFTKASALPGDGSGGKGRMKGINDGQFNILPLRGAADRRYLPRYREEPDESG